MIIEIDQSGKLEETNKNTVIAFSGNNYHRSILIKAREKRKLQQFFRKVGRPRMYIYRVFAILIFLLIQKHLKKIDRIVIDIEYMGKEKLIRNLITEKIHTIDSNFDSKIIIFEEVGKGSKAHDQAYYTYIKEYTPTHIVTAKDVLSEIIG